MHNRYCRLLLLTLCPSSICDFSNRSPKLPFMLEISFLLLSTIPLSLFYIFKGLIILSFNLLLIELINLSLIIYLLFCYLRMGDMTRPFIVIYEMSLKHYF